MHFNYNGVVAGEGIEQGFEEHECAREECHVEELNRNEIESESFRTKTAFREPEVE
jgi:hypothetical protein